MEIGIGKKCRTVIRGLYDGAFTQLAQLHPEMTKKSEIEFIGLDIDEIPMGTLKTARKKLVDSCPNLPISFDVIQGDIVRGLSFPDGYFGKLTKKTSIFHVIKRTLSNSYFKYFPSMQT